MALERAKIVVKPATVGTGIKVGLAKMKSGTAKMRLSISLAVAAAHGIGDGDKMEVLIGTGEHHGIIRIRKNNSAGDAIASRRDLKKGAYFCLSLGHQAAFVDRVEGSRWCQFEKLDEDEGGYIEIVLPRWADETAPKKSVTRQADTVTPIRPTAPARGVNVTSGLMGDPPPGRREMMAKAGDI